MCLKKTTSSLFKAVSKCIHKKEKVKTQEDQVWANMPCMECEECVYSHVMSSTVQMIGKMFTQ